MTALVASREAKDPWSRAELIAACGFLLLGVGLRLQQFVSSPALWLDEATLSSSIVQFDLLRLLRGPLLYGQTAPPGYLLLEWSLVHALGNDDWVLRLVPFLSSLVALFGSAMVSHQLLRGVARPIAIGLVATAAPFVLFAGQAKQYSTDVAVTMVLLALSIPLHRRPPQRGSWVIVLVVGGLAPWFSLPAAITLAGLSLSLAFVSLRAASPRSAGRALLALAPVLVIWGVSSLAALRFSRSRVTPEMMTALYEYWVGAFMPTPPPWSATLLWPVRALARVFYGVESAGLYYPVRGLFMSLALAGLVSLWRRLPGEFLVLPAPIALALLGGMAHQYPFADRLVLFLVPNLLFAVAEGLGWASRSLWQVWKPASALVVVGCCSLAAFPTLAAPPPYLAEDIKPLLAQLNKRRAPGEPVYVFCDSLPAFDLYVDRGQAPKDFIRGECHRQDPRAYFEQLDRLRGGSRVWVLIAHSLPSHLELENIRGYLDVIGVRRESHGVPARVPANSSSGSLPAFLYVYDLSDPKRGQTVSPATFELLGASH
jgi:hypothetical protein